MGIILIIISVIVILIVQGNLSYLGLKPDIPLLGAYFFGLFYGTPTGILTGVTLGLGMDITSAMPVYFNIFSKSLAGYAASIMNKWIQNPGLILHGIIISSLSLLQGLCVMIIFSFMEIIRLPGDIIYILIPQALLDGLAGMIIYYAIVKAKKIKFTRPGFKI